MPYKFGEYVSTYVDPQSVKISETLRERFLSNFQANDKLTMAVEEMQAAAAFENDVNRKKELQRRTENALAQLGERGDYENLGFQIHKTAKQFAKDYAPIEENYRRYQGALQEVSKAYEKGDVNAEYAQLYKSYMTRGYKGFELDPETGRVKEGSMFTAPGIVKDPKVFDRIKKAIEIINPKEYSGKSSNIQQGPDGMYKITTESGVKEIPKEVVQGAIDMVMDEPDVKAYIGQMSDMQAYNLYAQGRLPEVMQGQAERISSNIDALTKELESGKLNTATKKQYTNTLAKLRTELETINGASASDESAYSYVKQRLANDMFRPVEEFVMEAVPYRNVINSRDIDYDAMWLQDRKAAQDENAAAGASLQKYGEVTAADAYGGTLEEKQANIQQTYKQMIENKRLSTDPNISASDQAIYAQNAQMAENKINIIRQQIEVAANRIPMAQFEKIDPAMVAALKAAFPWAKNSGQLYLKLQDALQQPDPSNPEYVKLQNAFRTLNPNADLNSHIKTKYSSTMPGTTGGEGEGAGRGGAALAGIETPRTRVGTINDALSAFNSGTSINYNFTQVKESALFNYGKLDLGDPKLNVAMTKAIDEYFLNKPLGEDQYVMDVTDKGVQQLSGKELQGYKVIDRGWDRINNVWELKLENSETKDVKTVHYDGNNITSPIFQQLMGQQDVKFARIAGAMNSRVPGEKGITTREIRLLDKTGGYNTTLILESEITATGDQLFSIKTPDGKMVVDPGLNLTGKKYSINNESFKYFLNAVDEDNPRMPIVQLLN